MKPFYFLGPGLVFLGLTSQLRAQTAEGFMNHSLQNPQTQVVYVGIANNLQISGLKSVEATGADFSVQNQEGEYLRIVPLTAKPFVLSYQDAENVTHQIELTSLRVPVPEIRIGESTDSLVDKKSLVENPSVWAGFPASCLLSAEVLQAKILSCNLSFTLNGDYYEYNLPEGAIPSAALDKIQAGMKIYATDIRMTVPGGEIRNISGMYWTVQ